MGTLRRHKRMGGSLLKENNFRAAFRKGRLAVMRSSGA